MEKELVICDTNIFIHWFKGNSEVDYILQKKIGLTNIIIPAIVAMELIQGMGNKKELQSMLKKLSAFHIIEMNEKISFQTRSFISKFSLSHNLQIPDAIIASTAIIYDLPLYTYNLKDFKFLPNIKLKSY